jgi:hypothetical protein
VVGRDVWPSAKDEHNLPYIRAIIKEVRYEVMPLCVSLPKIVCLLIRWCVPTRRFGRRRLTFRPKILYTTGCTSQKTRCSFSTSTQSITMKRSTRTRTHPNFLYLRLALVHVDKVHPPLHDRFSFKPERFLGDTLTCAESSKLTDPIDRDHWAFGAG